MRTEGLETLSFPAPPSRPVSRVGGNILGIKTVGMWMRMMGINRIGVRMMRIRDRSQSMPATPPPPKKKVGVATPALFIYVLFKVLLLGILYTLDL